MPNRSAPSGEREFPVGERWTGGAEFMFPDGAVYQRRDGGWVHVRDVDPPRPTELVTAQSPDDVSPGNQPEAQAPADG